MIKPVSAPPTWAKCAIGPIENEFETPKNRSPAIKIGTKYFAFIGIGINIKKREMLGKRNANATKIPYSAPEAPSID